MLKPIHNVILKSAETQNNYRTDILSNYLVKLASRRKYNWHIGKTRIKFPYSTFHIPQWKSTNQCNRN